jgi:asparaginyl-tRNA synthetase
VNPPILTGNDCEGAGEAFRIYPDADSSGSSTQNNEFFDRPAYLTVSSQLHLEALAHALTRVYTISPCFRAEKSQTNRHLSEFWMLEAEWGFTKNVKEVCEVVEGSIKQLLRRQWESKDLQLLWKEGDERKRRSIEDAASQSWCRMTYTDAIGELIKNKTKFKFEPQWGKALQSEHERWLADKVVGGPVFVTDYPTTLKPFYMRVNENPETVACFDLLIPYLGELVGGSLREERAEFLERALERHGLSRSNYEWYTDLRTYGGAPHGGFGLGLERLISWVTGVENVRECIPIPRWAGRLLL